MTSYNNSNRLHHSSLSAARTVAQIRVKSLLAAASGLAISAVSLCGHALGLGEIEPESYLGQPLRASIQLVSVDSGLDPQDINVRQVGAAEAARMGVDLFFVPNKLSFQLDRSANGYQVLVRSDGPVKEPFLTLLVELRWPSGVVYREYPVLLDLPPVAADAPTRRQPAIEPAQPAAPPAGARSAVPSASPVRAAPRLELQALQTEEGRYRVRSGDTLSSIAQRWREGTDLSTHDASLWLFQNNPHAFVRGNMDRLKADALLQMPDVKEYQLRREEGTPESAPSEQAPPPGAESSPPATSARPTPIESVSAPTAPGDKPPTTEDAVVVSEARGLLTVGAGNRDDKTRELIDMLVRENDALRVRMERLESSEYLETLTNLVVAQRRQIADMRSQLGLEGSEQVDELDAIMARIGIDQNSGDSVGTGSASSAADTPASQQTVPAPLAVEGPELQLPEEPERAERTLLSWLAFAAGILLTALFTVLYLFYRKHAGKQPAHGAGDTQELPALTAAQIQRAELVAASKEPEQTSLHASGHYEPTKQLHQAWRARPLKRKNEEQVTPLTAEEPEDFSSLMLDEELLDVLTADEDARSLEAITQELKSSRERRSDAEVRMSIAEKMSSYRPEDSREQLESLGVTELDDLVDLSNVDEYNVDKVIYRAMMFCDFKKFSQARQLVEMVAQEQKDPRLEEALEQINLLEREHLKRANG